MRRTLLALTMVASLLFGSPSTAAAADDPFFVATNITNQTFYPYRLDGYRDVAELTVRTERAVVGTLSIVKNRAGQTVAEIDSTSLGTRLNFTWNGRTTDGEVAPTGRYTWVEVPPVARTP